MLIFGVLMTHHMRSCVHELTAYKFQMSAWFIAVLLVFIAC